MRSKKTPTPPTTVVNPSRLKLAELLDLLVRGGAEKATREQLARDIKRGCPRNADGTLHLAGYAAWLYQQVDTRWNARTIGEVAQFFGVNRRTVAEWIDRGMPRDGNVYPLDKIFPWLRETVWSRDAGGGGKDIDELKRRRAEVQLAREELELRQLAAELVSRRAALAAIEQFFAQLRSRWESLPEEICSALPRDMRADVLEDWRNKVALLLRECEAFGLEK